MTKVLKNRLITLCAYYDEIKKSNQKISSLKNEISVAKVGISKEPPKDDFKPNEFEKKEKLRQRQERAKKEEKINAEILKYEKAAILALGVVVFVLFLAIFWGSGFTGPTGILYGIIFGVVVAVIVTAVAGFFIYIAIFEPLNQRRIEKRIGEFEYDEKLMQKARDEDEAAEKAHILGIEKFKNDAKEKYNRVLADNTNLIELIKARIALLKMNAELFLSVPEDFRSFEGVNELINAYEDCCKEWCDGKDPQDVIELSCYCRAKNTVDARRSAAVNESRQNMAMAARVLEREHRAFMEEQERRRANLDYNSDKLDEETKKYQDAYNELKNKLS